MRPRAVKHVTVQEHAWSAREQMGFAGSFGVSLGQLKGLKSMAINGIDFEIFIDADNEVRDEHDELILGVCEVDPSSPDSAMISVTKVGPDNPEQLVLSTLAHEIGHAIYDAPSWIVDANRGPDLFGDSKSFEPRRATRTVTEDRSHLGKSIPEPKDLPSRDVYFSELRANEFMGSFLVPYRLLSAAVEAKANDFGVACRRPSLHEELKGGQLEILTSQYSNQDAIEELQFALSEDFGVHQRFIQVRMERYGILPRR